MLATISREARMRRIPLLLSLLVTGALVLGAASPAWTAPDGDTASEEPAVEDMDAVRVLTDEEAAAQIKEIKSLARKRDPAPLLQALEAMGDVTHEDLAAPLLSLLKHKSAPVALRAASLLKVQRIEKERDRGKLAKAVWKTGWSGRANDRRYAVRGRALRAYAALSGGVVDEGQYREVRKVWQRLIGDPRDAYAPGMVELCRYAREAKDKRMCRLLAEEIDTPLATDVNSPSNPPAAWWERRWKMWRDYHAEAVEALEVITGETFKTTNDAKEWFQSHESRFGFRW